MWRPKLLSNYYRIWRWICWFSQIQMNDWRNLCIGHRKLTSLPTNDIVDNYIENLNGSFPLLVCRWNPRYSPNNAFHIPEDAKIARELLECGLAGNQTSRWIRSTCWGMWWSDLPRSCKEYFPIVFDWSWCDSTTGRVWKISHRKLPWTAQDGFGYEFTGSAKIREG